MLKGISSVASRPSATGVQAKLKKATEEFEAMLLGDLLKSRPKVGTIDGGQDGSSVGGYDDFSTEAVATAMAAQGGVGIGRMLLKQLAPAATGTDIKAFSSDADHIIAGE
jgi:Rod binding domain-containing protein